MRSVSNLPWLSKFLDSKKQQSKFHNKWRSGSLVWPKVLSICTLQRRSRKAGVTAHLKHFHNIGKNLKFQKYCKWLQLSLKCIPRYIRLPEMPWGQS